jgi:3-methylcrotonyl-CoA carboxylase alpha subunit
MKKIIKSVLIANRGEIARRINRTVKSLGMKSICVFSDADASSELLNECDDSVWIGESESASSYLNITNIINAAKSVGADAIHPGYGFLSENPNFALECKKNSIIFIGPTDKTIELVADKRKAKEIAISVNVPTTPSVLIKEIDSSSIKKIAVEFADKHGLPLLIKAAFGGGGRGMRIIKSLDDIETLCKSASEESRKFFASSEIFIEKLIDSAKHIEVQLLGSENGEVISFGTRDCSYQRNYQKIIEEAPARSLSKELSETIEHAAIRIGKAVNYLGAGTVEFLVKGNDYYFLEVNSRLQVEHPVTEGIYNIDLVAAQIKIASGENISDIFDITKIKSTGHCIEARICAENPRLNFKPETGICSKILFSNKEPCKDQNFAVRYDFTFDNSGEITHYYDSMIGKVIVSAQNRDQAILGLKKSLSNLLTVGLTTNLEFIQKLLDDKNFTQDLVTSDYLSNNPVQFSDHSFYKAIIYSAYLWDNFDLKKSSITSSFRIYGEQSIKKVGFINSVEYNFELKCRKTNVNTFQISIDNHNFEIQINEQNLVSINNEDYLIYTKGSYYYLVGNKGAFVVSTQHYSLDKDNNGHFKNGVLHSPLSGKVITTAKNGESIVAGQTVVKIDSMKMEHQILAPYDCIVEDVQIIENQSILKDAKLLKIRRV